MTGGAAGIADGANGKGVRLGPWVGWTSLGLSLGLLSLVFSEGLFAVAALVVASATVISWVISRLGVEGLMVSRTLDRELVAIGECVEVKSVLSKSGRWPALFGLWREVNGAGLELVGSAAIGFATLPAGSRVSLAYKLYGRRRGVFGVGPSRVEVGDPLGLAGRVYSGARTDYVTVLPSTVPIERVVTGGGLHPLAPPNRSWFDDPSRLTGVRRYRSGDERRRIHWRATARLGRMVVKQYESSGLDGSMIVLEMAASEYGLRHDPMIAGEDPCAVLELAITTAASLAELASVDNLRVGLMSNGVDALEALGVGDADQLPAVVRRRSRRRGVPADAEIRAARGAEHLEHLRLALARVCVSGYLPIADLLTIELPRLSRSLQLAIVTPRLAAELVEVIDSLTASGLVVSVFLVGDSRPEDQTPGSCPLHVVETIRDLEVLAL